MNFETHTIKTFVPRTCQSERLILQIKVLSSRYRNWTHNPFTISQIFDLEQTQLVPHLQATTLRALWIKVLVAVDAHELARRYVVANVFRLFAQPNEISPPTMVTSVPPSYHARAHVLQPCVLSCASTCAAEAWRRIMHQHMCYTCVSCHAREHVLQKNGVAACTITCATVL